MKIVSVPGIVYESETDEQAAERDRHIAQHNAMVDAEIARWQPGPMRGYEKWIKQHAPHLLSGRRADEVYRAQRRYRQIHNLQPMRKNAILSDSDAQISP